MLNAVELLSPTDSQAALDKLDETVALFNGFKPNRTTQTMQLSQTLKAGDDDVTFSLEVPGINPGEFFRALKPLAPAEPSRATDSILKLRDETFLSDGVVALARALLN
jgi:hypothetical protein